MLKHQFYQQGHTVVVEVYQKHSTSSARQEGRDLIVVLDGNEFKQRVAFDFKLLGSNSSRSMMKLVMQLEVAFTAPVPALFESQKTIDLEEKYRKMDEAGALDEETGVGAALRSVYEQADDKTKEAMIRSYNESKGKVVSSTWSE